ncbi:MAG: 2-oxo acid dehydrogenase subunit E2 [Actinomycetales bacterium]|nr:2-oxo acid dehydrogenase subunit E2 [Actinomycetales bacterium]
MGAQRFLLPDVGEGLTEAEILTWHVKVGDTVKVNDVIVEIETAKASVELPCPFEGTVTALLVPEGKVVPVGTAIIEVDVAGMADAAPATPAPAAAVSASAAPTASPAPAVAPAAAAVPAPVVEPAGVREAVLVGYGVAGSSTKRRAKVAPRRRAAAPAANGAPQVYSTGAQVIARCKPPVRALAKQHGVDLRSVAPTGRHGDITRDDVMRATSGARPTGAPAAPAFAPPIIGTPRERIPVRGVLRSMAQAMVQSVSTAPHVTCWLEVDVTASTALVAALRQDPAFEGSRVTLLTLAALGVIKACDSHPRLNSSWIEGADGAEIVVHGHVGLGIAVAGGKGLVVPVVAEAETLSAPQLAAALTGLVERARNGSTAPAEMLGGTVTITNIGALGMDGGTPILVPGQSGILALGRVVRKPWVIKDDSGERVEVRDIATVALSFDHRIMDGEAGSKALKAVADFLAAPSV